MLAITSGPGLISILPQEPCITLRQLTRGGAWGLQICIGGIVRITSSFLREIKFIDKQSPDLLKLRKFVAKVLCVPDDDRIEMSLQFYISR